ncbi:hypothetical protein ABT298_14915 [Streptomyces sp. NPDC001034]|uniref:hypothetical protein n=1 Tax=Streptomyces sp. NPDC001034 TaxID=3154375 RepID=UPI00331FD76D
MPYSTLCPSALKAQTAPGQPSQAVYVWLLAARMAVLVVQVAWTTAWSLPIEAYPANATFRWAA